MMDHTRPWAHGARLGAACLAAFISFSMLLSPLVVRAVDATNLISNPGFESGESGWTLGFGSASTTAAWAVTQIDPHTGSNAAQLTVDEMGSGDDAKLVFSPVVSVTPGASYTFSTWYKSDAPSELGAYTTDGSYAFWIGSAAAATDWTQFSATVVIPESVSSLSFGQAISTPGMITTDDYSLTLASETPSNNAFPEGMVTLSFDDGWKSSYTHMPGILGGIKSTQFIFTDTIMNPDEYEVGSYMTVSDLQALRGAGHEIGAHSRTHAHLPTLDAAALASEVTGSKEDLMAQGLGTPVSFAYPFGEYNTAVIDAIKDAGFFGARTVDGGFNFKDDDRYLLKIHNVSETTTAEDISGWIQSAVTQKAWLILMFHEVLADGETCLSAEGGEDYSGCTTTDVLQATVDALAGVKTVTMAEGLQLMGAELPSTDDTTKPVVTTVTPVAATTTDTTPDYTFNTTEAGAITYGASCSSASTSAVAGDNTITFNTLALGTYSDCSITVTDAADNASDALPVPTFEVVASDVSAPTDTTPPVITLGDYEKGTTTGPITVTATTNEGTLNASSHTFTTNGSFDFVATDTAGNVATTTVTITNIVVPSDDTPAPTPVPATTGGGGGSLLNPSGSSSRANSTPRVVVAATSTSTTTPNTTTTSTTAATSTPNEGEVLGVDIFNFIANLRFGMRSDAVMELQKRLTTEGFFRASATGYFGPLTLAAVKAYQQTHGVPATGYVGPMTREELNRVKASSAAEGVTAASLVQLLVARGYLDEAKLNEYREMLQTQGYDL